jgi:TctA family transporter
LILSYRLVASSKNEALFSFWTAFLYFNYGGNFAIYPVAVADLFGQSRCGINYGVVYGIYSIVAAAILLILTFSMDPSSSWLTYSLAVIQGGGVLVGMSLRRERERTAAAAAAAGA